MSVAFSGWGDALSKVGEMISDSESVTVEGPKRYRLGRRNGELVLQGLYLLQRHQCYFAQEWRDLETVDLDAKEPS